MIEPMAQPTHKRRPDWAALAIAAGLLALGALVAWDSSRLGSGGAYARIGPQTIPYVIAIGLAGLAVWAAIEGALGEFPQREQQDKIPLLWIVGGLVAQMALIKFAGFSIATGILFAMTARGFDRVSLPKALLSGFLISAAVWFVFARLLQLTLPAGAIERLMIQGANIVVTALRPQAGPAA